MLNIQIFSFNPFSENTYLVFNENKKGFIIDPGNWNETETGTLQNFIENNGILKINEIILWKIKGDEACLFLLFGCFGFNFCCRFKYFKYSTDTWMNDLDLF